jgi:hypothetical protein
MQCGASQSAFLYTVTCLYPRSVQLIALVCWDTPLFLCNRFYFYTKGHFASFRVWAIMNDKGAGSTHMLCDGDEFSSTLGRHLNVYNFEEATTLSSNVATPLHLPTSHHRDFLACSRQCEVLSVFWTLVILFLIIILWFPGGMGWGAYFCIIVTIGIMLVRWLFLKCFGFLYILDKSSFFSGFNHFSKRD